LKGRKYRFVDIANVNLVSREAVTNGQTDYKADISQSEQIREQADDTGRTDFRADRLKGGNIICI